MGQGADMSETSMSDILSDAPAPEPAVATPEPATPEPAVQVETNAPGETEEQAQERGRDASGKFTKKEPDTPEPIKAVEPIKPVEVKPVQPQMTDKERAYLAAAQDERGKRQALERENAALKAAASKEPPKSFYDDPDAALKAHKDEIGQSIIKTKLDTTEAFARRQYPDFEEKIKVFGEIMQATPGMYQHWIGSADPAEFAYRTAKEAQERAEWQKVGGIEGMRSQIEKETRIKLEAEMKAKEEAAKKEREALPGTLSNAAGTSGPSRAAWGGPPSMSDILKG